MARTVYFVWIALFFSTCTPEDQPNRSDENLIQNLASGLWEISFFIVNGIDQSDDFNGVSFVFLQNGQVEALQGTQLLAQGTWGTQVNSGRIRFELSFPSNSDFGRLSADWYQEVILSNRIIFRKDLPNVEDILTFEKR